MKKLYILSVILSVIIMIGGGTIDKVLAQENEMVIITEDNIGEYLKDAKKEKDAPCSWGFRDEKNCPTCHSYPTMAIKESPPGQSRVYPHSDMWVHENIAYFQVGSIDGGFGNNFQKFLYYLDWHPKIYHIVLKIYSGGGSVFQGWRTIGYINEYKARGYLVETRNYGISASAAFLVFASGTKGHRFVSETSQIMGHEIRSYGSFLELFMGKTTSDSEEQARVARHLQQSLDKWLAGRGNLSYDEIVKKTTNREFWMTGADAIEYGFADGYIK